MKGALKILLLAALILLVTAQTNYRSLPDFYHKHIDKALKKANSIFGKGQHVAFRSIIGTPEFTEREWNVNVRLIITTCSKTSSDAYEHRDECNKQEQKKPIINCLVCKTENKQELVDCATMRDVANKKRDTIRKKCSKYIHGANALLHKSGVDETEIGCLGCL